MYEIIITKLTPNEKFNEELKEYQERQRWGAPLSQPIREFREEMLKVILTEEEYKVIKKAVLEIK